MLFALMAFDKEGALDVRMENRPAHLDYLDSTGVVKQAGPFLDADGNPCGSLIVLDVEDMAAAQSWADNDPYAKAGLFRDVQIKAWKQVIGA
ncbi:YciI family protein [Tateyamaria omphalii]|uniref:YciI family protein n=1 Tax=Tateyamaria omphalii TaxID=299262 RepID=UPI001C99C32B|nr:YciI family protein [Tateyamaria omphalii]MBY5933440.1 YciI family protein [Tateyamaria omphalii]